MGSIQFQDIIRQQLAQLGRMAETVGDHIQAIDAMLEDRRDDMDEETLSQELDNMFNNHVMAGQREIHTAAHGRAESLGRVWRYTQRFGPIGVDPAKH